LSGGTEAICELLTNPRTMGNTLPKEPIPTAVFIQEIQDAYAKKPKGDPILIVDSPVMLQYIREKRRFDGNGNAYLPNFDIIRHAARGFPPYTVRVNNSQLVFFFIQNLPSQRPPSRTDSSCSTKDSRLEVPKEYQPPPYESAPSSQQQTESEQEHPRAPRLHLSLVS
jgi:hypothetical protein